MVVPHPWFECYPAILNLDGPGQDDALGMNTVERVWARMSDAERHRFHRFTCEGDQSPETMAVIRTMTEAIGG